MKDIIGPITLGEHMPVWERIERAVKRAKAAGEISGERAPLTETEEAFFIASDKFVEPMAFAVFYEPEWCEERGRLLWLDILFVQPLHRRNGLGTVLATSVMFEARRRGIDRVEFGTKVDNAGMHKIAGQLGFVADHLVFKRRDLTLDGTEHSAMPEGGR